MHKPRRVDPSEIPDPPDRDDKPVPPIEQLVASLHEDVLDGRWLKRCGFTTFDTHITQAEGFSPENVTIQLGVTGSDKEIEVNGPAWLVLRPLLRTRSDAEEASRRLQALTAWLDEHVPEYTKEQIGYTEDRELSPEQQRDLRFLVAQCRDAVRAR